MLVKFDFDATAPDRVIGLSLLPKILLGDHVFAHKPATDGRTLGWTTISYTLSVPRIRLTLWDR